MLITGMYQVRDGQFQGCSNVGERLILERKEYGNEERALDWRRPCLRCSLRGTGVKWAVGRGGGSNRTRERAFRTESRWEQMAAAERARPAQRCEGLARPGTHTCSLTGLLLPALTQPTRRPGATTSSYEHPPESNVKNSVKET